MKIVLLDKKWDKAKIKECQQVPRVGDCISWDYAPHPRVTDVLWFPDIKQQQKLCDAMKIPFRDPIEAIVML